jgi:hypothetical protein
MRWREIALAFVVSSTFALFVGSLVAQIVADWFAQNGQMNVRVYGAVMYTMAVSSHVLIPVLIGRTRRFFAAWNGFTEAGK